MRRIIIVLQLILLSSLSSFSQIGSELFVDSSINISGNGNSWNTAFKTLSEALDSAWQYPNVEKIFVAQGTYKPINFFYTMNSAQKGIAKTLGQNLGVAGYNIENRDRTFHIRQGLEIYGGFPSGGGLQNSNLYFSILDGADVGNIVGDSAYNVISIINSSNWTNLNDTTFINGFVIQNGSSTNNTPQFQTFGNNNRKTGAGLISISVILKLTSNIFRNNFSKSSICEIYASNKYSFINNSTFSNNVSGYYSSAINVSNFCIFDNNKVLNNINGGIAVGANSIISNNLFENNSEYYAISGSNNTTIEKNTIVNNKGTGMNNYGGGIAVGSYNNGVVYVNKNLIINNSVGIIASIGRNIVTNNLIAENDGKGFLNNNTGKNVICNNTFFKNHDGGAYCGNGTNFFNNNIFYGNTKIQNSIPVSVDFGSSLSITNCTFKYNLLQNFQSSYTPYLIGYNAEGNMFGANPGFLDTLNLIGPDNIYRTADDGLNLNINSFLIDAGIDSLIPSGIITDIIDSNRIKFTTVDLGAYEATILPCLSSILYVDSSINNSGNGTNWSSAFKTLGEALDIAHHCPDVEKIFVAKGTYIPTSYPFDMRINKKGFPANFSNTKNKTFHIRSGLEVYGGFPNGGGQQNISTNETILTGGNLNGNILDTAFHVVVIDSSTNWGMTNDTSILEGFTIKNGNGISAVNFMINNSNIGNYGAGIAILKGTNIINQNIIKENKANYGAGIAISNGNNLCSKNFFKNNSSINYGGGVYSKGGINNFIENNINSNSANSAGGIFSENSEINFNKDSIISNYSYSDGGGIYAYHSKININKCLFSNDSVSDNGSISHNGSSVYLYKCKDSILNSFFNNNIGLDCIYIDSCNNSYLYNNNINNNSKTAIRLKINSNSILESNILFNNNVNNNNIWGGGIFSDNDYSIISRNYFYNNKAQKGGAIYTQSSSNIISNNIISNNASQNEGAGIFTLNSISNIKGNFILNNLITGTYNGAGIYLNNPQNSIIESNLIKGNYTNGYGGGIAINDGIVKFVNNTLDSNRAITGGALYTILGISTVANNIFSKNIAFNSALVAGADYQKSTNSSNNNFYNNLLQLNSSIYTSNSNSLNYIGNNASNNIFNQVPNYVNQYDLDGTDNLLRTADDGFRIKTTSICLNSGSNSFIPISTITDIIDSLRIQNTIVDIGAYEGGIYVCIPTSSVIYDSICLGDYYIFNGNLIHTSGSYYDTIVNAGGCDSIITLSLFVNQPTSSSISISSCDTFIWNINGQIYVNSGIYIDSNINIFGCLHIDSLILTINQSTSNYQLDTACISYFWNKSGQTYTTSGLYINNTTNAMGCVHIDSLQLVINNPSTTLLNVSNCQQFLWNQNGINYTQSGTYFDTLINSNGCDSILTLNLTINNVNNSISQSSDTLTSIANGATYQWINCNPYTIISGANFQNYVATNNGSYAVIVTQNNCTDTSNCIILTTVGIKYLENNNYPQLYPNPVSDFLTIKKNNTSENYSLKIYSMTSQLFYHEEYNSKNETTINVSKLPKGIYIVEMTQHAQKSRLKFVKE